MKKFIQLLLAAAFLTLMGTQVQAQCTFTSPFGSATISGNGVTTISTCSFGGEFSTISGAAAGQTLKFTSSVGSDFITIHSGSSNGPVVGFGQTPLTINNTFNGTLFAHWSTNASCGTQSSCRTTTVQCTSCPGPQPGQCTFTSSFGSAAINTAGTIVTISTCSFAGEFSTISGAVAGQVLKFTSSAGDYATVHTGSAAGPVIAFGTMPLSFTNTFTGTLFVHWSTNAACGTQSSCRTTTVQCVSCLPPPAPANDLCGSAISIACGGSIAGSTTNATFEAAPTCGTSVDNNPSVWYKVTGTGGFVTLATCGGTTNFDSKLHVYTGSCGAFVCEAGNDDNCGLASSVTFCSVLGQQYFVRVSGFNTASGNFTLSMNCAAPAVSVNGVGPLCSTGASVTLSATFPGGTFSGPGVSGNTFNPATAGPGTHVVTYTVCSVVATTSITVLAPAANDACANAIAMGCNSSVQGSTTCSSIDAGLTFCGTTGGAAGNWYTIVGNGGHVTLSTCNSFTNYDTKLHVFEGTCGALTCVTGNDDYSSVNLTCATSNLRSIVKFCTEVGKTYYVLVSGFGSGVGNYQVDASCVAPLAVDAGACQSRFLGYTGPGAPDDTLYICPTTTGGTAPYTTTISPSASYTCQNGCFAVAPSATTTYTVTVTDANGCSASDQVVVNVLNVSGPNSPCATPGNPNKVQICHIPPGNPGNANTLCVGASAVPAHLAHGDYIGPCGNPCRSTNPSCAPATCAGGAFTITISGTGFLDEVTWSFAGATGGPFSFGTTNSATVTVPGGNASTFTLETQGSFNDNVAQYSISCGGNVILTGTLLGGQTLTEGGICCGGVVAPKMATQNAATGISVYPNPFTDVTNFKFRSATKGHASILVYNMAGKQVATAFDAEVAEQGVYEVKFDATGLSAGMYLYRYTNSEGKMSMGKVNLIH